MRIATIIALGALSLTAASTVPAQEAPALYSGKLPGGIPDQLHPVRQRQGPALHDIDKVMFDFEIVTQRIARRLLRREHRGDGAIRRHVHRLLLRADNGKRSSPGCQFQRRRAAEA